MQTATLDLLRRQLEDRRNRLEGAVEAHPGEHLLISLLGKVDSALAALGSADFGRCLVCREHVSESDLVRSPLLSYCLCDLTPAQQRALERDLELATRIQSALLPDPDLRAGPWDAHYCYEPAGPVSGDYCDLYLVPDGVGGLFFAVGDVSGKGVAASLLMSHLHASFRALLGTGQPLTGLVERVNQQLLEASIPSHYATLACGHADGQGGVELVNAGHCPPLVRRSGGLEEVPPTGLPIGLFADRPYGSHRFTLAPGDALVLYTDGVSEARGAQGDEFGAGGVERGLRDDAAASSRQLVDGLRGRLGEFLGEGRPTDDLTILALRRVATG